MKAERKTGTPPMSTAVASAPSAEARAVPSPAPGAEIDVGIAGMTCASCVRRAEKAIGAVPGVAGVAVNLATERARVALAPGKPDAVAAAAAAVGEAVRKAGYEPLAAAFDLAVEGMTCA